MLDLERSLHPLAVNSDISTLTRAAETAAELIRLEADVHPDKVGSPIRIFTLTPGRKATSVLLPK